MTARIPLMLRIIAITSVVGLSMLASSPASARSSLAPTVPGPCDLEFRYSPQGYSTSYPLAHPNGDLAVNMTQVNGIPTLVSVCVMPGWTVENKSAVDGIQLAFFYNGQSAIDFKYVLGKTQIRFR